jgi:rubredoxin
MYRCQLCNRVSRPGERATKVVLERRPTEYPSRGKAQKARTGRRSKLQDDPGGAGYEIAKEAMVCPTCAAEQHAKEAAQEEALGL